MNTLVKICGLTQPEDADWANELKPDYVGFVFAESRRRVTAAQAAGIASRIDSRIKKVGVFVNPSRRELEDILYECPLDVLQLHGEETEDLVCGIGLSIWKVIRVRSPGTLKRLDFRADAVVLDSWSDHAHGGTNTVFPWEWASDVKFEMPVILAGGLNPDNVSDAIQVVRPYAVDVSSGVETNGIKDAEKIKAFIGKVRNGNG